MRSLVFSLALTSMAIVQPARAGADTPLAAAEASASPTTLVERFEILSDTPAYDGRSFGQYGVYRHIQARAHLRIDPDHPRNAGIVDLAAAPRGADGRVAYSTDVVLLMPGNPAEARRVLVAEVPNRGMRLMMSLYRAGKSMPEFTPYAAPLDKPEGIGNGFIEQRGYTVVWVGWQSAVRGIKASFPPVLENGMPVTGPVRISNVFDKQDKVLDWALAYPSASLDLASVTVTVRADQASPARPLPAASISFVDEKTLRIERPDDMDAGAIYELVYTASGAEVSGLGFAATRDVIAFLRSGAPDAAGNANPLAGLTAAECVFTTIAACLATAGQTVDVAIGIGGSQSGRYLRDMLYQGFNEAESGMRVFDGMVPFIAGSRRTFTNRRWAEPGRFSRQHEERLVYGDQFPFTYDSITDTVSGERDGLMVACRATHTCPKIMQVDTSAEFWMAGASLVGTSTDGTRDVAFPDDVRAYFIASGTHQTNNGSPVAAFAGNTLASGPLLRALMVDMEEWITRETPPPPSRWPSIADGTLASPATREGFGFPDLAPIGLDYRGSVYRLNLTDYSQVPPAEHPDQPYTIRVPRTDADGNDAGGVRLPAIAAPLGTHLGWNPRKPGFAEGQQASLAGSYIPFAADAAQRRETSDPRLSRQERYPDPDAYVSAVRQAAEQLQRARLMLPEDVAEAVEIAVGTYGARDTPPE